MANIELIDIKKNYGPVPAVKGINLVVADGEMIVLVGPSGCGKSTLLRMIAGLESITSGHLKIGGRDVSRVEPAERDIAMVFQNYALYPHMSVRQNLEYGLKNRGFQRDDIARRVTDAAAILEIEPYLERRPRQLSGGQRQRVAMGRAIVRNPAAFLFDEPLSNLDAKLRVQMRVEIRKLQKRLGTTSLYVTHDQLEAMTLADRLVVMNGGRIEQIGTPIDVYERPETLFVAGFIGSPPMNLVDLDKIGGAVTWPGLPPNTDVVGIRPDAFSLTQNTANSVPLTGMIELIEPIGGESHLHIVIEGSSQTVIAAHAGRSPLSEGETATWHVNPADLHCFNKSSGQRTD
ncbi:glycerol-3-phosphate ABC transporter ATP-binding protein [Devosia limi DSM 17137]|uniref:Glycerol-3-phosphate ABC transporter ATP-binding protein n=1 Tax=Devosia limi DSM 17137 TaxID=1121477 RepID=A0A0F5LVZ1_9HYPH|nr:sn-glycerol-3-phosphate import ATP-binding protein UgpC [Devosia limi]KKB85822.1 glycerol-3-phosphate ABC transporter ATP-binding protein [Devosia limi DSM 17137]SHE34377.1 sn-glycerol 3-phosphate transport system ATP-binding protein [Devosia limi DSM 17137]